MFTIAADIGGTFTDVVVIDERNGGLNVGKALTTPDDLQSGVMNGLSLAAQEMGRQVDDLLGDTRRFVHATTQSSNAVFAYSGATTAVLTSAGFEDTLMIMRATGRVAGLSVFERHHYRKTQKPRPLVDERDIFGVAERVDSQGLVVQPLNEDRVRSIAEILRQRGIQAVAVAFLFSHMNPDHEERVGEILREELPDIYIALSSRVAPVMGEYERSATALFDAYVGPVIEGYISRLQETLQEAGYGRDILIVQANGGVAMAAQSVPVFTIESGPAAGIVGSAHLAERLGHSDVIATDVGGTTFKVAIIEGGRWRYARETVLNQYQLRLPMIDVTSIGAGGGSIAWADGQRLRIGPESAAADPGPACYDLGGDRPTVTDADVVLGYIAPDNFLGGRMKLNADLAADAIQKHVADPLYGGDTLAAAAGIRRVTDSQMADLIRKTTLERGHDPRRFTMMAYGGSGPTHAASYGAEVGVGEIIIPLFASVLSAYGAARTDVRFSLQISDPLVLPVEAARVEAIFARLEQQGAAQLEDAHTPPEQRRFQRWVEARYRRQVHTVRVEVPKVVDKEGLQAMADGFESEYERLFGAGSALREAGIELITFSIDAIGLVNIPDEPGIGAHGPAVPRTHRPAYCPHRRKMVRTPVYDGTALGQGAEFAGPALVEHPGTTIVVLTGQRAQVDDYRHLHIFTGEPAEGEIDG